MDIILLSLICFIFLVTIFVFLGLARWYFKKEISGMKVEIIRQTQRELLPIKFQAFERLTLFLERISPESLILREQNSSMNNMNLQRTLLSSIRKEYEHNQAMQIYVSSETWERVKLAKEEIVRVVNLCSAELSPVNPSIELAKTVIERFQFSGQSHLNRALESIRNEVKSLSQL